MTKVSGPFEFKRYRYVILAVLIMIIILVLSSRKDLHKVGRNINWKGLIVYLIIVIALFAILMKLQGTSNSLNDHQWSTLHFTFYFFLAYFVRDSLLLVLIFQVAWELFEDSMTFKFGIKTYEENDLKKVSDIFINTSGYLLGSALFRNGGALAPHH
ncbi:MAG: hypothetical protein ACMG6E_03960 [Candidatus Roizmanbacteria bacterium]